MRKSVGGADNVIFLNDSEKEIRRKIMAAQTGTAPLTGGAMTGPMENIYMLLKICTPNNVYNDYLDKS